MVKEFFIAILFLPVLNAKAQFAPAVGRPGSTAIHKDSSIIAAWATHCSVVRGWQNINNTSLGKVTYGSDTCAIGPADNKVVSLGDSGFAVVSFDGVIYDGEGYDFAVFENAFNDNFLELAFVEVSSDSIHWARFASVSLTDTTNQVGPFDTLNPEKIHNLAGKYRALYGTPFDLAELPETPFVDVNNIKYIRIIDVIGSVKTDKYSLDSQGHKINDPYPTEFETGGFDLDAVAAINIVQSNIPEIQTQKVKIYPNPASEYIIVKRQSRIINTISIYNVAGVMICKQNVNKNSTKIDLTTLPQGLYILKIDNECVYKFIKR